MASAIFLPLNLYVENLFLDVQPIRAVSSLQPAFASAVSRLSSDMQPVFAPANSQYITTILRSTVKVGGSQSQNHAHRKFGLKVRNPTPRDNSLLVRETTENGSKIQQL